MPEDTRSLEAEIDYAPNSTFHWAAADRQAQSACPRIGKTSAIALEVVEVALESF